MCVIDEIKQSKPKLFTQFLSLPLNLLTTNLPQSRMESLRSGSGKISMLEGSKVQPQKAPLPTWLQPLLAARFFVQCVKHANKSRKIINRFCLDCKTSLCPNCVIEHPNGGKHHLIQIRHYVHSDVIRVNDIFKLLNIAKIQHYIANGVDVVHLNPKSSKPCPEGVPKSYLEGTPCIVCFRAIGKRSLFCSIACKIKHPAKEAILSIKANGEGSNKSKAGVKCCITKKQESSASAASEPTPEKKDDAPPVWTSYNKKTRKGIPIKGRPAIEGILIEVTGEGSNQPGVVGMKRCITEKEDSSASSASEPAPEKKDDGPPVWVSYRKKSRKGIPVRAAFF